MSHHGGVYMFAYTSQVKSWEELTGKSYESAVRENLLEPADALGMELTSDLIDDPKPYEVTYCHRAGRLWQPYDGRCLRVMSPEVGSRRRPI